MPGPRKRRRSSWRPPGPSALSRPRSIRSPWKAECGKVSSAGSSGRMSILTQRKILVDRQLVKCSRPSDLRSSEAGSSQDHQHLGRDRPVTPGSSQEPERTEAEEPDHYQDQGLVFAKEWAQMGCTLCSPGGSAPGQQHRPAGVRRHHREGESPDDQVSRYAPYMRNAATSRRRSRPCRLREARAQGNRDHAERLRSRLARPARGRSGALGALLHRQVEKSEQF